METEATEPKNIFVQITKGIPKPIIYTLISAMIVGAISFSYAFAKQTNNTNNDFPQEVAKTTLLNQKVDKLSIDVELLKNNGANTNQKVNDISNKQDDDHDLLQEIKGLLKQVNNNTK